LSSLNSIEGISFANVSCTLKKKNNDEGLCHKNVAGKYRFVHFLILTLDRAV